MIGERQDGFVIALGDLNDRPLFVQKDENISSALLDNARLFDTVMEANEYRSNLNELWQRKGTIVRAVRESKPTTRLIA